LIPHESNILESRNFKTIDSIDLVEIDLKINKIFNKFIKRVFDFIISTILILFLFPIKAVFFKKDNRFNKTYSRLINVFSGKYSFVGISELENVKNENLKLGKYGLTGLAQINTDGNTTDEEKIKYNILYARNQSFLLDIEILFRTMMAYFKKRNH
jgi:lipopolysaccharide/colanic/teichoic acid biosynthesis glycosyltransferase